MTKTEQLKDILAELRALQDRAFEDDGVAMDIEVRNYRGEEDPSLDGTTAIHVWIRRVRDNDTAKSFDYYSFRDEADNIFMLEQAKAHYETITKKL